MVQAELVEPGEHLLGAALQIGEPVPLLAKARRDDQCGLPAPC